MTSTINASNSGAGGVITTADSSGILSLQGAAVTGLTINASGALGLGTSPAYGTAGQPLLAGGSLAQATFGTLNITAGGTGQTNQHDAFNALAPITSVGDLIIGDGVNSSIRLPIGTVNQVLTSTGTTATWSTPATGVSTFSAGTTGLTPASATNGTVTLGGTLVIANGGTNGSASPIAGAIAYGSGTAYSFTAAGTSSQVLLSGGAGTPTWASQSALAAGTATTATNVAGGAAGSLVYQTGAATTSTLALGTTNYVLTAGASAPQYVAQSTLAVGTATNVAGGAASQLHYQTGVGATGFIANGTAGQVLTSAGASVPTWSGISGGTF